MHLALFVFTVLTWAAVIVGHLPVVGELLAQAVRLVARRTRRWWPGSGRHRVRDGGVR